jgi:hypothetical protein
MATTNNDFMETKWRSMMGVMYMVVCIFDFMVAPIGWTFVQFWEEESMNDAFRQWDPITLYGAGFFHIAMGAILGISAYGKTQENLADKANTETEE